MPNIYIATPVFNGNCFYRYERMPDDKYGISSQEKWDAAVEMAKVKNAQFLDLTHESDYNIFNHDQKFEAISLPFAGMYLLKLPDNWTPEFFKENEDDLDESMENVGM